MDFFLINKKGYKPSFATIATMLSDIFFSTLPKPRRDFSIILTYFLNFIKLPRPNQNEGRE